MNDIPADWTLSASTFNWTPVIARGERSAVDLAVDVVATGIASSIEIEAGQLWRGFPAPTAAETDGLRANLAAAGGAVSIFGASIDDWTPQGRRRTLDERVDFLVPQLHAAHRVGAFGVRVPLGQAGREMLDRVRPVLHELDLVLFEEAQGHQTPTASAPAYETIAELDDPHIRLLIDISMLMPALPESYLERLQRGGVDADLVQRLRTAWRDPATDAAVFAALREGRVPPAVHTLFMNLVVRFGRSDASELAGVAPLISGVHLKFWDLDDADGRVSAPIRDLARLLRASGFRGTLCSEWGGHEWIDDLTPEQATTRHLALARSAIGA